MFTPRSTPLFFTAAMVVGTFLSGCDSNDISTLKGFSYFPGTNFVSENNQITVSGTALESSVSAIQVNGQDVETSDGFENWSLTVTLAPGDTDIVIDVIDETGEQYKPIEYTARYNGVIAQSLESLHFDGTEFLYFSDYKRDEVIQHELTTGYQAALGLAEISGLAEGIDRLSVIAVSGDKLYVIARGDNLGLLYVINATTKVATEIVATVLPDNAPPDFIALPDIEHGYLSDDNTTLYVLSNNPPSVTAIDVTNGDKTRIVTEDSYGDDAEVNYLRTITMDPDEKVLYVGNNYPDKYISIDLTGDDAGRFVDLPDASASEGCAEIDYGWGLLYDSARHSLQTGRNGTVSNFDISTGCLTSDFSFDQATLQMSTGSLQGLAKNNQTGEYYVGFFPGIAAYNPSTGNQQTLEKRGFVDAPYLIEEPELLAVNSQTEVIYSYEDNEESLVAFDPQTSSVTSLFSWGEDVEDMVMDEAAQRLWISIEDLSLGYIDVSRQALDNPEYIAVTNEEIHGEANLSFSFIALADDGRLFALSDSRDPSVYQVDKTSGAVTLISADGQDGISLDQVIGMGFDNASQQLIILDRESTSQGRLLRVSSVDVQTAARTLVNDGTSLPIGWSYGFQYDEIEKSIYTTRSSQIYRYDFATDYLSVFVETTKQDSDLGDLTDIAVKPDGTIVVSDDDVNGFWHINPFTNERVVIQ